MKHFAVLLLALPLVAQTSAPTVPEDLLHGFWKAQAQKVAADAGFNAAQQRIIDFCTSKQMGVALNQQTQEPVCTAPAKKEEPAKK